MSDSVNQPRTFEVLTAAPVRARRQAARLAEREEGAPDCRDVVCWSHVSAIARAEGLDPSQLYGWRRKALSSALVAHPDGNREEGGQVRAR